MGTRVRIPSRVSCRESLTGCITRRIRRERSIYGIKMRRATARVMKPNESVKNDPCARAQKRRGISLGWTRAKYPHSDEALMAPLTLRHELNDGGCFISERKLVSPISVRAGTVTIASPA